VVDTESIKQLKVKLYKIIVQEFVILKFVKKIANFCYYKNSLCIFRASDESRHVLVRKIELFMKFEFISQLAVHQLFG